MSTATRHPRRHRTLLTGYHAVTRCLSIARQDDVRARVPADFTRGFGHEIGLLNREVAAQGVIVRIDTNLE